MQTGARGPHARENDLAAAAKMKLTAISLFILRPPAGATRPRITVYLRGGDYYLPPRVGAPSRATSPAYVNEPRNEGRLAAKSIPFGSSHVRCTPMGVHRTRRWVDEIKKAAHTRVLVSLSSAVPLACAVWGGASRLCVLGQRCAGQAHNNNVKKR